eukprot:1178693-Prorocentrum_minimum.AAC.2
MEPVNPNTNGGPILPLSRTSLYPASLQMDRREEPNGLTLPEAARASPEPILGLTSYNLDVEGVGSTNVANASSKVALHRNGKAVNISSFAVSGTTPHIEKRHVSTGVCKPIFGEGLGLGLLRALRSLLRQLRWSQGRFARLIQHCSMRVIYYAIYAHGERAQECYIAFLGSKPYALGKGEVDNAWRRIVRDTIFYPSARIIYEGWSVQGRHEQSNLSANLW